MTDFDHHTRACLGACPTFPRCNCPWTIVSVKRPAPAAEKALPGHYLLASTSSYRAELLRRLQLDFTAGAPGVDEVHEQTEKPEHRATRLAEQKCNALANHFPNQIVIGSDQVAACNNEVLDKPGSIPVAIDQLQRMTGQTVTFYTAVNMQRASDNKRYSHVDLTTVTLRSDLSKEAIERYIAADNPLDCAGSFKVESLGISLFDSVQSTDPTALVGLPLIAVANVLRRFNHTLP